MAVTVQSWGPAQYQIGAGAGLATVSISQVAAADPAVLTWTANDAIASVLVRVPAEVALLTWTASPALAATSPIYALGDAEVSTEIALVCEADTQIALVCEVATTLSLTAEVFKWS